MKRLLITLIGTILLWLAAASPSLTMAAGGPCGQSYTVVFGDTLNQIAERCQTSIPALLRANPGIDNPNLIYVGTRLEIPPPQEEDSQTVYTVRRGDTLGQIAAKFQTTVSALVRANPEITNPDLITVGQRLAIPEQREPDRPTVTISPTRGPPGTTVQVRGRGLPPSTSLQVGAGVVNTEFGVVDRAATDRNGRLNTELTIPNFAQPGEEWVVVVRQVEQGGGRATSNLFQVSQDATGPGMITTQIYLIALEDGGRMGREIGCGDSVVPVQVELNPTSNVLEATLKKLLALDSRRYGQQELYNALHRSDLQVANVTIRNGQALINLTGTVRLGGVCDNPRFQAQLEETALQFPAVDQVTIFINDQSLESFLSQK